MPNVIEHVEPGGSVVVAPGVDARRLPGRGEVERSVDIEPAPSELGDRHFDVGNDEVQAPDRTGRHLGDALAERDGASGAGWRGLDHAKVLVGPVIDEQVESSRVDVERLHPVDIGDRENDEFELHIHGG